MVLAQLRFVVEQVDVRWPAGHEEVNHPLSLGREMQRLQRAQRELALAGFRRKEARVKHRRQSSSSDSRGHPTEEMSARQEGREFAVKVHDSSFGYRLVQIK